MYGSIRTMRSDRLPCLRRCEVQLANVDQALLIVDLQVGLIPTVRDWEPNTFRNSIFAHGAIGKLYNLPTVLTTSVETGPNGPLPKEFLEMYPHAPLIARPGEIDAWDNPDFRKAVEATGKKQVIIAGITTDVCTSSWHNCLFYRKLSNGY